MSISRSKLAIGFLDWIYNFVINSSRKMRASRLINVPSVGVMNGDDDTNDDNGHVVQFNQITRDEIDVPSKEIQCQLFGFVVVVVVVVVGGKFGGQKGIGRRETKGNLVTHEIDFIEAPH